MDYPQMPNTKEYVGDKTGLLAMVTVLFGIIGFVAFNRIEIFVQSLAITALITQVDVSLSWNKRLKEKDWEDWRLNFFVLNGGGFAFTVLELIFIFILTGDFRVALFASVVILLIYRATLNAIMFKDIDTNNIEAQVDPDDKIKKYYTEDGINNIYIPKLEDAKT